MPSKGRNDSSSECCSKLARSASADAEIPFSFVVFHTGNDDKVPSFGVANSHESEGDAFMTGKTVS